MEDDEIKKLKDRLHENTNQFYAFREKYTYYVLAINAACIGFAVSLTKDATLSWSLVPLAIALILWMTSFYLGIKKLQISEMIIGRTFNMIEAKLYNEPSSHNEHSKNLTILYKKYERNTKFKMTCFYIGVIIFIFWNILNIYLRTFMK